MPSVVMMKRQEVYLSRKPLELFELLVKREVVNRDGIWDYLWGSMPEADQPKDVKAVDVMLHQIRKVARTEGVDIANTAEGYRIPEEQKERAQKLLEILKATPKKKAGAAAKYTPEAIAIAGHVEPQQKRGRKPNLALLEQEFKIESDIPIPDASGYYTLLFAKFQAMKPGDSFKAEGPYEEIKKTIYNASQTFRYKHPGGRDYFFTMRPEHGGVRIWRLKEPTFRHKRQEMKDYTGKFQKKKS